MEFNMKIEMLGMSVGCPACTLVKNKLDKSNLDYTYYDVLKEEDRVIEMRKEMKQMGLRTVPAMWINNKFHGAGLGGITIV
jgi:glutaredoxin